MALNAKPKLLHISVAFSKLDLQKKSYRTQCAHQWSLERPPILPRIHRECVSTGAAGARTLRSLGHQLLHPLILRLLVLYAPADFEPQSSPL